MGFTWICWVFTGFSRVLSSFTGFYWVLLGLTEFYRLLLGFTGFYWVLLGFTGCYWGLFFFRAPEMRVIRLDARFLYPHTAVYYVNLYGSPGFGSSDGVVFVLDSSAPRSLCYDHVTSLTCNRSAFTGFYRVYD